MDKELKNKWIAALRSGEYTQGTTFLYNRSHPMNNKETYCCLGVLCEVAIPEVFKKNVETFSTQDNYDWIRTTVNNRSVVDHLMTMNDTIGNTFSEIADYIEENIATA